MANLVVHFEIHATDPQQLTDFYSGVFDWKFTRFGDMEYWSIDTGDGSIRSAEGAAGMGINGGLMRREGPAPTPGAPVNGCNVVVSVDDVDGTFARALQLGGTQVRGPEDMQGVGRIAVMCDPDGNVFSFLSPRLSDGTTAMG